MLRNRLISGFSLAGVVMVLLVLDAVLGHAPSLPLLGLDPPLSTWLRHGLFPTVLVTVLTALLTRELIHLAHLQGYRPLRFESQFFAIGLVLGPYLSYNLKENGLFYDESWSGLWLTIALAYAFVMQAVRRGTEGVMINLATTMFIIFYAGGLGGYLTKLRMEVGGSQGAVLLLYSMFVVKMTDVGAYFTGRLLGRNKFIPWLSPKKTWEGVIGGVVVAGLTSVGLGHLASGYDWLPGYALVGHTWYLLGFGVVMATFSIAGDLAGSLLKRDAAVKDSSQMIPGMGGVLDIFDSPLLAAPAAWFFWTRLAPLL